MNRILTAEIQVPKTVKLSQEGNDFLLGLLQKVPANRLGCREEGAEELKKHPWFKDIDWDKLQEKQIKPPVVPNVRSAMDTQNFDEEFT